MNAQDTNIGNRRSAMVAAQREVAGDGRGDVAARNAADWISLAAAPTFALMALLTGILGGPAHIICSPAQGASPLSGMVLMYLLMSVFHSTPWLKLMSRRRNGEGQG
jgi:hypothetical protein